MRHQHWLARGRALRHGVQCQRARHACAPPGLDLPAQRQPRPQADEPGIENTGRPVRLHAATLTAGQGRFHAAGPGQGTEPGQPVHPPGRGLPRLDRLQYHAHTLLRRGYRHGQVSGSRHAQRLCGTSHARLDVDTRHVHPCEARRRGTQHGRRLCDRREPEQDKGHDQRRLQQAWCRDHAHCRGAHREQVSPELGRHRHCPANRCRPLQLDELPASSCRHPYRPRRALRHEPLARVHGPQGPPGPGTGRRHHRQHRPPPLSRLQPPRA